MNQQFEQLILPLNAGRAGADHAVLTDPFAEDLNPGVPVFQDVESGVTPSPRQGFMRRVAGRAVEASYKAGAKWTTMTSQQKRVVGLVTLAGVAAGVGIGALDHGSVAQAPHFVDAAYHPGQLHPTLMSNLHDHVSTGFSAEVNGHAVEAHNSSGLHFTADVNGKPVSPHITHQPVSLHTTHKPVTAPKAAVHKPATTFKLKENFVAEVNHQPITPEQLHQSVQQHAADMAAHHGHYIINHTHTGKVVNHHSTGQHNQHHNTHATDNHRTHSGHVPTPGKTYSMRSGDNPWTISQRALGISRHGHTTQHQLHQIWLYNQQLLHLNKITTEQAKYLQIGRKLLLPKV
jgi:hypothetical protein